MEKIRSDIRVRYSEIAGDHAYYASYYGWIEANMGGFYRKHRLPYLGFEKQGVSTMVAEAVCKFVRPARYDDVVSVSSELAAAAPKRVMFDHEITRAGEVLAQARTTHVLLQAGAEGPQVFPEELRSLAARQVERVEVLDKPGDFPAGEPPASRNVVEIPVRFRETDAAGAVYFANHYVYFEVGRAEFLRAAGMTFCGLKAGGLRLPVARAYCRYLAPIGYGDSVMIATWISEVKKVQLTFRYELVRKSDGVPFAVGFTAHGCLDATGRPVKVPVGLHALLGPVASV